MTKEMDDYFAEKQEKEVSGEKSSKKGAGRELNPGPQRDEEQILLLSDTFFHCLNRLNEETFPRM